MTAGGAVESGSGTDRPAGGPLAGLISMRMVVLFAMMRRSMIVTQRRDFDLSETEWRILSTLGAFAPLSLNGLADRLAQDRGQLSRAVTAMVRRGLVSRSRKPGGPEVDIALTASGDALHDQMVERAFARDTFLTEGIDPEELGVAKRVVNQMIDRAGKLLEQAMEDEAG
jgi:DNA-binding MarR family transcriptional regulator